MAARSIPGDVAICFLHPVCGWRHFPPWPDGAGDTAVKRINSKWLTRGQHGFTPQRILKPTHQRGGGEVWCLPLPCLPVLTDSEAASGGTGGNTAHVGRVGRGHSARMSAAERGQRQSRESERKCRVPQENCSAGERLLSPTQRGRPIKKRYVLLAMAIRRALSAVQPPDECSETEAAPRRQLRCSFGPMCTAVELWAWFRKSGRQTDRQTDGRTDERADRRTAPLLTSCSWSDV